MIDKNGMAHSGFTAFLFVALGASLLFHSCAGGAMTAAENTQPERPDAPEEPRQSHSLIVPSPQELYFNGNRQPLKVEYSGDDDPEIIYYPTPRARDEERGGSYSAPARVGAYFALVRCRYGEARAELRIVKRKVIISAESNQEAVYNGNPKRVQVEVDPPLTVFFSYYPNRELMESAIAAEKQNSGMSFSQTLQGYRRVERAPTEPGIYYVWIYYPGDENNTAAEATVTFRILPAVQAR